MLFSLHHYRHQNVKRHRRDAEENNQHNEGGNAALEWLLDATDAIVKVEPAAPVDEESEEDEGDCDEGGIAEEEDGEDRTIHKNDQ